MPASEVAAKEYLVRDQKAYKTAVKMARPGDTIVLANGQWKDFEILFRGKGKKNKPIRLTAQDKGKVLLTGQSNLRLAGEYLEVSGLVFKDGYSPTQTVISFRRTKEEFANHSRVTEVVIDNYNQPERQETDFWVLIFGKHNRFDHNHLIGKRNRGVTLAVRLNTKASQKNHHRIDHNYFGPRPILGSNGGETLRIGTSHYSRTDSNTIVENNYFDRCDGELEIISIKSGRNTVRNNTFFRSRGTLTMRHGNNNLIEGNVFFGQGADHTGGIRVINGGQTVRNNYMEGLSGTRFGGALVVMNGVPNSPINRYDQVKDATIAFNSIINSDHIQLAAGSDDERSAVPVDSTFQNNLLFNKQKRDTFTIYDDISGIHFANNLTNSPTPFKKGFQFIDLKMERAKNGLLYPIGDYKGGVPRSLKVTQKAATGVGWYKKAKLVTPFESGSRQRITNEEGALYAAVQKAASGDTIVLAPGHYVVNKIIRLNKAITLKGEDASISYTRSTLFEIQSGGSLQLINLSISGADSPDYAGNSVIRTSRYSMLENFRIDIDNSRFTHLDKNRAFNVIAAAKGTFADYIHINNSQFSDVTGSIAQLNKEDDDFGIYNAEYLDIRQSSFQNIQGSIVDYYRGGRDESTFGPHFTLLNSKLDNVGLGANNKSDASLLLHGVQVTQISQNNISDVAAFRINHTVGEPKTKITDNQFANTPPFQIAELNSLKKDTALLKNNHGLSQ
ncbi:MAG: chondroitinase-B domain-containing protein [Gammaproteobacteria bacterium]